MSDILIVGGGPSGLITGYFLSQQGIPVTIVEEKEEIGGLLKTINIDGIDIEAVYHHILFNDDNLLRLISKLNLEKRLKWHRSNVALYTHNKYYNISTPFNYLSLDFINKKRRFELIMKLTFPDTNAKSLNQLLGDEIYKAFFEDMLINKFGIYAKEIHPSWLINKIKKRGRSRCVVFERLGYLCGSFKIFIEKIVEHINKNCGKILLNTSIQSIKKNESNFEVLIGNTFYRFDKIIFTISPYDIAESVCNIDPLFASELKKLDFMSNITILFYTKKNLTNYYWVNIADRNIKLTGIISQSNLVKYEKANGFFTYISLYLPRDDPLLNEEDESLKEFVISELKKMKIDFNDNEIIYYKVTKTKYAQPLYFSDKDLILSNLTTPIKGIYILNNHSILPEDRGVDNIISKAEMLLGLLG